MPSPSRSSSYSSGPLTLTGAAPIERTSAQSRSLTIGRHGVYDAWQSDPPAPPTSERGVAWTVAGDDPADGEVAGAHSPIAAVLAESWARVSRSAYFWSGGTVMTCANPRRTSSRFTRTYSPPGPTNHTCRKSRPNWSVSETSSSRYTSRPSINDRLAAAAASAQPLIVGS